MSSTVTGYRLSPLQMRLWQAWQGAGPTVQTVLRLEGRLQREALQSALDQVINRHEILRTRVEKLEGIQVPVQVIEEQAHVRLGEIDLSGLDGTAQEQEWAQVIAEAETGTAGAQYVLGRWSADEHRLLIALPAQNADRATLRLVVQDLARAYGSGYAAWDEEPVQYLQVSEWLNEMSEAEEGEAGREHWQGQRLAAHELPQVPFAIRWENAAFMPSKRLTRVESALAQGLQSAAEQADVTLADALFGAWQMLIARLSGGAELVIGRVFDGRKYEELAEACGPFASALPVRSPQTEGLTALDWLRATATASEDAEAWQEFYEEQAAMPVLFEAAAAASAVAAGGIVWAPEQEETCTDRPLLKLTALTEAQGVQLEFLWNAAALPGDYAELIADAYLTLLASIAANPHADAERLNVLSAAERQRLVVEFNRTDAPFPQEQGVHERFAAQAAKTPHATAITFADGSWTYAELNARANRIAHRLQTCVTGREALVGICADRTPELVAALLGIWKAGAAYVPIDPTYPAERIAYMLDDAAVQVLLTEQHLMDRLPVPAGVTVLCLEDELADYSADNPDLAGDPDALAYVMYTSGSTGRPKGAMITHRGLNNYLHWAGNTYGVSAGTRVPVHSSVAFDLTVTSLYLPLLNGGSLLLLSERDGVEALGEALMEPGGFGLVKLTPAHLNLLKHQLDPAQAANSTRVLVIGGENLLDEQTAFWREHAPDTVLYNEYGPTETVVGCMIYRALPTGEAGGSVPIGAPIDNMRIYLLDKHLHPVPAGTAGELHIGGVGVARGYWQRPELTAERFLPDPFVDAPHARMYKTGDLARFRPDGTVEYLGRLDHQVKIRGYRIETGEIENVLAEHPTLTHAAVLLREDEPGEQKLCAYVVPADGADVSGQDLRNYLLQKLPEPMVPSLFIPLKALPLTQNGKVDRTALPAPDAGRAQEAAEYVAPRTEIERQLADIFQQVLQVERVGIADNFFALGGDSILSIQILHRASQQGIRFKPKDVFEQKTIAALAKVVTVDDPQDTVAKAAAKVTGSVLLTPIQTWFFQRKLAEPQHYNFPVLLEAQEKVDPTALRSAIAELIEHHDVLRARYRLEDGAWRQEVLAVAGETPFVTVDLSGLAFAEQEAAFAAEAERVQQSLDLENGPPIRFVHFAFGAAQPERLLAVAHHLVTDGVSMRILLSDLERAYRQQLAGEPIQLPAKTATLKDWTERLAAHAQSDELLAEAEHWLQTLEGAEDLLPDSLTQQSSASRQEVAVTFTEAETKALLQEASQAYNTRINDLLLTALALAFAEQTGRSSLAVELEGHGREELFDDLDLTRVAGWLTALYPVRLELPPGSVSDRIKSVKEQLRTIPRHGVGYGLLCAYGTGDSADRLRSLPSPSVSFNYLGQLDASGDTGAVFTVSARDFGPAVSGKNARSHRLEIDGGVLGGQLQLKFGFDGAEGLPFVQGLADAYQSALRQLIAHCLSEEAGGFTPSDFPEAGCSQEQLDAFLQQLEDRGVALQGLEQLYRLSPAQEGILFHTLLSPDTGVYVLQNSVELHGVMDQDAMEQAWRGLVQHHDVLRTAFYWEGLKTPLQAVYRAVELPLMWEDWRDLPPAAQAEHMAAFLAEDRKRGLAIGDAPLVRVTVVRTAEETHRLIWTSHHLILDGWSMPLLFAELAAAYAAHVRGEQAVWASRRPYRDYIAWLNRQDSAEADAYWSQQLADFTEPNRLLLAGQTGADFSVGMAETKLLERTLPEAMTKQLQEAAASHQVTLNTLLQAAWTILLSRMSGKEDVVFGVTVAGRPTELAGAEAMTGMFINTLPLRQMVPAGMTVAELLQELQTKQSGMREYEQVPLIRVRQLSGVSNDRQLFETILVFENYPMGQRTGDSFGGLTAASVEADEMTNYPLTVMALPGRELKLQLQYDCARYERAAIERMIGHFTTLLTGLLTLEAASTIGQLTMLTAAERELWEVLNAPQALSQPELCLHRMFEQQAAATPDVAAVVFENQAWTYRELNEQANRIAHRLQTLGAGPDVRVALHMERSLAMMAAMLGILKSGSAYVPIAAHNPEERIRDLLEDAQAQLVVTEQALAGKTKESGLTQVLVDADAAEIAKESSFNPDSAVTAEHLAYVMYTSGSTGKPKGVMIEHRSVGNFFAGMDREVGVNGQDTLLAVTSVGFDISVLELLYTICRGAKVVLLSEREAAGGLSRVQTNKTGNGMEFSLFYFASDGSEAEPGAKYRLLLDGAKYADQHGFKAVWTPERHFNQFGGLYPNPAVMASALSMVTERIKLRAGSVVLPLHHPIRVAEDWSVIDNLSGGRVELSFASGWHADDFVLAPDNYQDRKELMFQGIETVQQLWRGEQIPFRGGADNMVPISILPQPLQPELPVWVTTAGNPEMFIRAGASGAHVLTHLLDQSIEALAEKIALYRQARQEHGFDPNTGQVAVMLHTFLGVDRDAVREKVRGPFISYLRSSAGLLDNLARSLNLDVRIDKLTAADMEDVLGYAFERYFETSGLFGTPETALERVHQLKQMGVDEIACLIDFGVDHPSVLDSLQHLNSLRQACVPRTDQAEFTLAKQALAHRPTLLQCTPSMMKMISHDGEAMAGLQSLRTLLLGGEALPKAQAQELAERLPARILNMYGPTEATIWATCAEVRPEEQDVLIGRPLPNVEAWVLDVHGQPVPAGSAGELHLAGACLARGYWQRPELTAEAFVPHPFATKSGARLYKTGDLVRVLPDGNLQYLGRTDDQIKLRGHRIELGEIEAKLTEHPVVKEAVVRLVQAEGAEPRLAAYVTAHTKLLPSDQDFRDFLKQRLPAAMIPSVFMRIDAVPLTPNGKTDRKALPDPEQAVRQSNYLAPVTAAEKLAAEVWQDVLAIAQIGQHDHFFEIGGHSLQVTQVMSRLMNEHGVELPLRALFEAPVLTEFAKRIEEKQQAGRKGEEPDLKKASRAAYARKR